MFETILNDSEKNLDIADNMFSLASFFSLDKGFIDNYANQKRESPRLDFLSYIIPNIGIYAYDNEELLTKFPNGIVTETFLLVPSHIMETIKENFAYVHVHKDVRNGNTPYLHHDQKRYAEFFVEPLISCLQLNLNIELTDEEKKEIYKDIQSLPSNKECPEYILNATAIKNSELLKSIDNKNLSLCHYLEKYESFNDRKNYLTTFLKNKNSYKFPTIQNALNNLPTVKIDHNISLENFDSFSHELHENVKTLLILNEKFNEVKKGLNCHEDSDFETFLNKSKKDLFPFLVKANDLVFENVLSIMTNSLFQDLNNEIKILDSKKVSDIAKAIYEFTDCTMHKRTIMINVLTDLSHVQGLIFIDNEAILKNKLAKSKPKLKM